MRAVDDASASMARSVSVLVRHRDTMCFCMAIVKGHRAGAEVTPPFLLVARSSQRNGSTDVVYRVRAALCKSARMTLVAKPHLARSQMP